MRFQVRYYRDEWIILDRDTGEVMRLNMRAEYVFERATRLALHLSENPGDKMPSKWLPVR